MFLITPYNTVSTYVIYYKYLTIWFGRLSQRWRVFTAIQFLVERHNSCNPFIIRFFFVNS